MLGCKCCSSSSISDFSLELIDTCWDVNSAPEELEHNDFYELIDTCWDVNSKAGCSCHQHGCELIDTCWDVN